MGIKMTKELTLSQCYQGVVIGESTVSKVVVVTIDMLTFFKNEGVISTSIKFDVDDGQVVAGNSYTFSPTPGGKIPIEQAYDHLMTLDEFVGATLIEE